LCSFQGRPIEDEEDRKEGRDRQIEGIVAAHAMQSLAGAAEGHAYPPFYAI
jgi:hypothetical protein